MEIDHQPLVGAWRNTNPQTRGIELVNSGVNTSGPSGLAVEAFSTRHGEHREWGTAPIDCIYASRGDQTAAGFTAKYEFGFSVVRLQCNLAKGLLIITALTQYQDDSSRANLFCREFFHRRVEVDQ